MVKVTKSPNMMSTTGRIPVMAAPTASPVNPASEIGVSTTRSLPNSSSNPESTLKGVPASATSSPMMQTVFRGASLQPVPRESPERTSAPEQPSQAYTSS